MRVRFTQTVNGPDDALAALEGLVYRNVQQMRRKRLPPLYESGARYKRAPRESHWASALEVLAAKGGDCEDLAAYRAAELRHSGRDPNATLMLRAGGRPGLWHVLVRRGNGEMEDPSKVLGMSRRRKVRP